MSQASHKFKGSVDFNQNELRNATFQRLTTPPISPVQGQLYYNTPIQVPFYWNETKWLPFGLPPVHIKYTNQTDLIAGQSNQISGYIYYRSDIDIYYEYLGTTLGTMADYNPIGGAGTSNNIVKTIHIEETFLSGTGSLQSQVAAYINANIAIDYNVQLSKINIIISKSSEGFPYAFPLTLS